MRLGVVPIAFQPLLMIGVKTAHRSSPPCFPRSSEFRRSVATSAMRKIDSHLHVWAPKEQIDKFPYADGATEPPVPGHVEVLLECMENVGVDGALIVQPSNHKFDHSYVTSVLQRFPNKFVGCLLANPDDSGVGVSQMEQLVKDDGYQCVRFNPYIWPNGQKMTNKVGRELYETAGTLGVPVAYMPFKGLLMHMDEIETLLNEYPETKVIVDHFGFCQSAEPTSEAWEKLMGLAKFPQVYVKVSAFFRISEQEFPYLDVRPCLRQLVDAFGPKRLMWGTDFPWVQEQCGYTKAWEILDVGDQKEGKNLLSDEEKEWVMGKTTMSLFPMGWK